MRGRCCTFSIVILAGIAFGSGVTVVSEACAQDAPRTAARTTPAARPDADIQKLLAAAARSSRELREESVDSFNRSLLPLTDHLEHLSATYEAETRAAYEQALRQGGTVGGYETNQPPQLSPQDQRKLLQPVLQARLGALQDAVNRLVEFRQPASVGWEADVALARFALNQAQLETARITGQRLPAAQFAAADQQLAADHYWKRLADANVGLASVPAVLQAVSLLNVAPEVRRNFYQRAADQTAVWASVGAGIGRPDAVTQADLDLNWLGAYSQRGQTQRTVNEQRWKESDQLAQTLFQQRLEFYPKGTATLGDLSRAWATRQHMHQIARDLNVPVPEASQHEQTRNLKTLQNAAAATIDRRGRHAADVTYVRLLAELKATEPTR
jgi:hypothetical protein